MDAATAPATGIDLFAEEVLADPYPTYARLRAAGEAVRLDSLGMFALPGYAANRCALGNPEVFTSERGVALNEPVNEMVGDIIVHNDGELHARMRGVLAAQLSPRHVRQLTIDIEAEADGLVARVVERGTFDAMADLAEILPVSVVARLIGLPEEKRMKLLDWAEHAFTTFGPMNGQTLAALPHVAEFFEYLSTTCAPEHLAPDSWGAAIYAAADRGEIPPESCFNLMFALAGAGMGTTISALGSALWLFATHPRQWQLVRDDPARIRNAFHEVIRIESPIQFFSRVLRRDHRFGDVVLPEGARAIVMYGSANRDDAKFAGADRFDVERRNAAEHLAFGFGLHSCVGQTLARIEVEAVLGALVRRVRRLECGEPTWAVNNITRQIGTLPMAVTAA
ncbi:MAG TPA: cytochrome P450 [Acidimicrobiia bacterium]|nr:cytochrome P450 [Acidimicrobiia bacterium]